MVKGKPVASTPKTAAGRRTIPLDESLVALLRSLRAVQTAERLKAGPAYGSTGHVVASELGRPHSPEWITDRFQTLRAAAGSRESGCTTRGTRPGR